MTEEQLKDLKSVDVICMENGSTVICVLAKNDPDIETTIPMFYPCFLYINNNKEFLKPFFAKPKKAMIYKPHISIAYTCEDPKLIQTFIEVFLEQRIVKPNNNLIN